MALLVYLARTWVYLALFVSTSLYLVSPARLRDYTLPWLYLTLLLSTMAPLDGFSAVGGYICAQSIVHS